MWKIYPLELAAELETRSRLLVLMGEYTPLDTTQLDSTCSLFSFQFLSQIRGSRRELVANSVHTADADAMCWLRRYVGVYWANLSAVIVN